MSPRTVLTLANRRSIDLRNPRAEDIDFEVVAEHLAKEKRYNGATPGVEYSVAQHCVIGVCAAIAGTKNELLAAYILLHDGHEAFLKDDTTPKKNALAEIAQEKFGVLADVINKSYDELAYRFDAAIHEAAGLPWPPPDDLKADIKHYDMRLFVTEWRDLMGNQPHPDWDRYKQFAPLDVHIEPVDWKTARANFLFWCRHLLPTQMRSVPRISAADAGEMLRREAYL